MIRIGVYERRFCDRDKWYHRKDITSVRDGDQLALTCKMTIDIHSRGGKRYFIILNRMGEKIEEEVALDQEFEIGLKMRVEDFLQGEDHAVNEWGTGNENN